MTQIPGGVKSRQVTRFETIREMKRGARRGRQIRREKRRDRREGESLQRRYDTLTVALAKRAVSQLSKR